MLEWKKRCKNDTTIVSQRKIWETKCGTYKVIFSHITLGEGAIPDTYYAIRVDLTGDRRTETILSRHRKKNPAVKACEKDHKQKENQ